MLEARIPRMNCSFDDVLGQFCYKNQCNTIITMGEPRVTRRVNQENPVRGSILTAASSLNSMVQGYVGRWILREYVNSLTTGGRTA